MCTIFFLFFFIANLLSVSANFWLSIWTSKSKSTADDNSDESKLLNLMIYIILGFGQCIVSLGSDYLYLISSLVGAKLMHNSMLFSILRSTMEFFESTPSGRIINRFSKDIEAVERNIPDSFRSFIRCIFQVFFTVLVIVYSTPLFLITLIPIIIIYLIVQRYFVASMRQLKRLESASTSTIFSHFSESLTGTTSIRAYKAERRFVKGMEQHVDENLIYAMACLECSFNIINYMLG